MENVRTRAELARRMAATTTLESMPPLRSAPSGTSATSRTRTASSIRCRNSSRSSASDSCRFALVRQLPVPFDGDAPLLEHEMVSRRQFPDALDCGTRRWDDTPRQIPIDRRGVGRRIDRRVVEQGAELGRKAQLGSARPIQERLLPEPIAAEPQTAPARIPQRKREHAAAGARSPACLPVRRDAGSFRCRCLSETHVRGLRDRGAAPRNCRSRR